MRTIDIVRMRRCGASIAEISKKAGIPAKEVSNRLKAYECQTRDHICAAILRSSAGHVYTGKHPEQKGGSA